MSPPAIVRGDDDLGRLLAIRIHTKSACCDGQSGHVAGDSENPGAVRSTINRTWLVFLGAAGRRSVVKQSRKPDSDRVDHLTCRVVVHGHGEPLVDWEAQTGDQLASRHHHDRIQSRIK